MPNKSQALIIHSAALSSTNHTVKVGGDIIYIYIYNIYIMVKLEMVVLYTLRVHICDYSSTMYEWQHFMKDESSNR